MKKRINPAVKAHLTRSAFYLLLLPGVCLIPFALGQRTTGDRSTTANIAQLPATSSDSGAGALAMPEFPLAGVWNQYDNPATEPPLGIGSQQFEPALNTLDDQVADDFVLTAAPPPDVPLHYRSARHRRIFYGRRPGVIVQRLPLRKWDGQPSRNADRLVPQPALYRNAP
jgi:hypothetical protein